jgi:hypothetical protein
MSPMFRAFLPIYLHVLTSRQLSHVRELRSLSPVPTSWAYVCSTEFELGPIGEASIGNVGKRPPTMAVVDLVVTPIGGFASIVLEDYIDKRFID